MFHFFFRQNYEFEIFWIKFMVQQWNLYVDPLQILHRIFQVLSVFRPDPKPIKVSNTNLFFFFFTLMIFGSYPVCEQQSPMCYLNLQNAWSHVTKPRSVLALVKLMGVVKPSRPGFPTSSLGYKTRGFKQAELWKKKNLKYQQNFCLFDCLMCG